jgi:4-hydroxy-3-polyprenylbenzoate decarboxylase
MYNTFQEFLKILERHGEVKRVREPVSAHLEISRHTDGQSKSPGGGKALYFENVIGSKFPVCTNMFGSSRRICLALGVDSLDELGDRVREYIAFHPPRSLKEALNILPMAVSLTRFFPRTFRGGTPPCQEVVRKGEAVDLDEIPILHCWPKDAGRFITLPMVFTKGLSDGKQNIGMYRMQVFNKRTTGMHWHIHKDGSHYFSEYRKAGKRMPVSVAIGADPATIYSATAPMPRGIDEILLAGFIRKQPVRMAKCLTNDLRVPAEAEFVLEGYVDPEERRREGPFGDHTGYYSLADDYPVFHVSAVTHRQNPVYPATLVGRPPMEDCYLAKATERLFLPMLQTVMPEIIDYWFPWEGVFHNIVVVSIEKEYPGHAHKLMSGLWGQGQMSFCKAIVIVDADTNPQDPKAVLAGVAERMDVTTDITVTRGILDVLDHSSPYPNFGNKIGIDLTRRFEGEPPRRTPFSRKPPLPADTLSRVIRERLTGGIDFRILLKGSSGQANAIAAITVEKAFGRGGKELAEHLFRIEELEPFNILILYDKTIDLEDGSLLLWKLFNNVDPGRDIILRNGRAVIDACIKGPMDQHDREWPEELSFDI